MNPQSVRRPASARACRESPHPWKFLRHAIACLSAAMLAACGGSNPAAGPQPGPGAAPAAPTKVRIGHFPNVTHTHGLVAHALSRQQKGVFEKHLGQGAVVEWYVFNAGPSAMESLMTGGLDATYVGPNPALNAYTKTKGAEVRVLGGATNGGSALVVRQAAGIEKPEQFRGRRIATPQLGNTQDVVCRAWLGEQGMKVTLTGGDVQVVPTDNPDQLSLFQSGALDAAWTVEPWVSRLEMEGGGKVFLEERDSLTTIFVGRAKFVAERPAVVEKLRAAHAELTQWIAAHPDEAKALVRGELEALTRRPMKQELVDRCWPRLHFTDTVELAAFQSFVDKARAAGLANESPDLGKLFYQPPGATQR